jgi:hypothetical protein
MTLEELQAKRAAIIDRLASLERRITAGDRTVEYDLNAAKHALEVIDTEIAKAGNVKRYSFASFRKG